MIRELKGITWDHSRALPPLVAAAQRYEETHPDVRIRWEKRSLHEFGHMPIDQLADRYDLIVIDHPWAGFCFERELVHDLRPLLGEERFKELAGKFIGPSWASYLCEERMLAIPIDAATPAPSWRPDRMKDHGIEPPSVWSEVVALADRGLAVMPAFPADLFLNWSMLLAALDAKPFEDAAQLALRDSALEAMDLLKRLAENMPDEIYDWNPIRLAEQMTQSDSCVYCPFGYTYNNYARSSFTSKPLRYGNLVSLEDGRRLRSIAGGTGLAITRGCGSVGDALDFSLFCASPEIQAGIYALSGGQPARREAWDNDLLNCLSNDFFRASRLTHEEALVRPRYDGYVPLQEQAGKPLQEYLRGRMGLGDAWDKINQSYRASLTAQGARLA